MMIDIEFSANTNLLIKANNHKSCESCTNRKHNTLLSVEFIFS